MANKFALNRLQQELNLLSVSAGNKITRESRSPVEHLFGPLHYKQPLYPSE